MWNVKCVCIEVTVISLRHCFRWRNPSNDLRWHPAYSNTYIVVEVWQQRIWDIIECLSKLLVVSICRTPTIIRVIKIQDTRLPYKGRKLALEREESFHFQVERHFPHVSLRDIYCSSMKPTNANYSCVFFAYNILRRIILFPQKRW